jgi:hypothetical protein
MIFSEKGLFRYTLVTPTFDCPRKSIFDDPPDTLFQYLFSKPLIERVVCVFWKMAQKGQKPYTTLHMRAEKLKGLYAFSAENGPKPPLSSFTSFTHLISM